MSAEKRGNQDPSRKRPHQIHHLHRSAFDAAHRRAPDSERDTVDTLKERATATIKSQDPLRLEGEAAAEDFVQALGHFLAKSYPA